MIKVIHKKQTDQEIYEALKISHKENPALYRDPEEWKKAQLKELKKQGKVWSK